MAINITNITNIYYMASSTRSGLGTATGIKDMLIFPLLGTAALFTIIKEAPAVGRVLKSGWRKLSAGYVHTDKHGSLEHDESVTLRHVTSLDHLALPCPGELV